MDLAYIDQLGQHPDLKAFLCFWFTVLKIGTFSRTKKKRSRIYCCVLLCFHCDKCYHRCQVLVPGGNDENHEESQGIPFIRLRLLQIPWNLLVGITIFTRTTH